LLSFEESLRVAAVFVEMGVRRIRITGGEPLVRKDVGRLIGMITRMEQAPEVVMTSNATLLGQRAETLAAAGLSGVNISLDSLDPERFAEMTRGGELGRVLAGVRASIAAGLEVKLNTVVIGGQNDDELEEIVDFAWGLGITPRFIELMPLGQRRREQPGHVVPTATIIERLGSKLHTEVGSSVSGRGPARYIEAADGSGRRVGFISAMTDEFCGDCNRVRLNALGEIRACLASRKAISLRDLIRSGASDDRLAWAAHWALRGKDLGHGFNDAAVREHENVGMSLIGG
jgi:cyclic pyranopterin phosphate synthase